VLRYHLLSAREIAWARAVIQITADPSYLYALRDDGEIFRLVNHGWQPVEEDVTLQVTDGHGEPYILVNASRLTGWVSSGKGTPLTVKPVKWRRYFPARSLHPR
jgi:hypothetical protein